MPKPTVAFMGFKSVFEDIKSKLENADKKHHDDGLCQAKEGCTKKATHQRPYLCDEHMKKRNELIAELSGRSVLKGVRVVKL